MSGRPGVANDADIVGVIGATGSGKSLWTKQRLARLKPPRLVVWDFNREYAPPGAGCTMPTAIAAMQRPRFKVHFHPTIENPKVMAAEFDLICRAALLAGNCMLVVEELSQVTKPMNAPPGWRRVVFTGRHHGLSVIGTSQRPASIDKDFLGSCSLLHVGQQSYKGDVDTMAGWLMVDREEVQQLKPLQWIEREKKTATVRRGTVVFRGGS